MVSIRIRRKERGREEKLTIVNVNPFVSLIPYPSHD